MNQPKKIITNEQLTGIIIVVAIIVTIKVFTGLVKQKNIDIATNPDLSEIKIVTPKNKPLLQIFDPNTVDSITLQQMGFSKRQIKNIIHYRDRGGKFYTSEDLKKLYTISDSFYRAMATFIQIDTARLKKKNYFDFEAKLKHDSLFRDSLYQSYKAKRDSMRYRDSLKFDSLFSFSATHEKKDTILEINAADENTLQYIKGIGPYTAQQIIHYRELLGGYASVQQIKELNIQSNMPLDSIVAHLIVNQDSIHPILVNHSSIQKLQRHPYISFNQAKEIYELRRKKIKLKNINELSILPSISDSDIIKIQPYISFEQWK